MIKICDGSPLYYGNVLGIIFIYCVCRNPSWTPKTLPDGCNHPAAFWLSFWCLTRLLKKWPASLGKLWQLFQACRTTFLDKCGKPHFLVICSIYVNNLNPFRLNLGSHPLSRLIEPQILTIYIHTTRKLPHSSGRLRRRYYKEILLKIKLNESVKTSNFGSKLLPEIRYFWHAFSKTLLPILILKIIFWLPNLTSNFQTHKNVGDNFWLYI